MKPSERMEAIIGRVRYRVQGSTLLAHDAYWDGHNYERHGRNTYLYRTPRGRYFAVYLTLWQGERDRIEALSVDEATALYEQLPVKEVPWEEAFPTLELEEA